VRRAATVALAALFALAAGCGGGDSGGAPEHGLPRAPERITLRSPAFAAGETIPAEFSCGSKVPPLVYSGAPAGARELAIVMRDLDAPGGEYRHWSGWRIDPRPAGTLGAPRVQGHNDFGDDGYGGPCPPKGDTPHRYVFTLYALGKPVDAEAGAKPDAVNQALAKADPLASGELTGRFGR
jgi:Raf kinase inhibitor-like YbhB/YbcL family protein